MLGLSSRPDNYARRGLQISYTGFSLIALDKHGASASGGTVHTPISRATTPAIPNLLAVEQRFPVVPLSFCDANTCAPYVEYQRRRLSLERSSLSPSDDTRPTQTQLPSEFIPEEIKSRLLKGSLYR